MSSSIRPLSFSLLSIILWFALGIVGGVPVHAGPGVWTPLGVGAGYGGIGCLTAPSRLPGAVWACLPQGGLYRSADRGSTWRWSGFWNGATAMADDPARPGALWAATGSAVYRTEDGGLHWVQLTDAGYAAALEEREPIIIASVPGMLYVASSRRLLGSADNGRNWTILYDMGESDGIATFAAPASQPQDLYIAGHDVDGAFFLRSADRGATWQDLTDRLFPQVGISQLGGTPTALYSYVGGSIRSLFRSYDRGESWLKVGKPPIFADLLAVGSGGALYVAGSGGLARSLDGGATWKVVLRVPDTEGSCAQISFQPENPDRLDLAVGGTIWRSANKGRSWSLRGAPFWVSALDVDPEDPYRLVAVVDWYAYLSENGGRTWRRTSSALWYSESLTRVDRHTLIAAGAGLYRSGDNGETWQTVLQPWPPGTDIGRWPQKVEIDPADPAKVYALVFQVDDMELPHGPLAGYPSSLWRSVDRGRTWRKVAQNLRAFAIDRGTSRLYGVRNQNILVSDDGGRSWKTVARTPHLVQDLVIDPTDSDIFYIAGQGVSQSTDRGVTWRLLGDRSVTSEIYALTLHPADPRTLYAADRWGVYEMTVP